MRCILMLSFFLPLFLSGQSNFPSYPQVLKTFFRDHNDGSLSLPEGLNFAKKRDGWYVQVADQMTEEVKKEFLFWPSATGKFRTISEFAGSLGGDYTSKKISEYLQNFSTYNYYGYERCRYFGYPGWELDMINEFGKQTVSTLPDTLIEGLSRAYSSYANTFLWNPFGSNIDKTDSFHRQLGSLEIPSPARIDSAVYFFDKTIAALEVLAKHSPSHQTRVGNSGMKAFNETIHAWMQMDLCGNTAMAKKYLARIKPNKTVTSFARNYLTNLPANSILFTAGDNDTYTLLYLQETEGYRKDVAVINLSLLGLPRYLQQLETKKGVRFSTIADQYGPPSFLYSVYHENGKEEEIPLEYLIAIIQTTKFPDSAANGNAVATYPQKKVHLQVDLDRFRNICSAKYLSPIVNIELKNYLTIDQFMVLDILQTNLYQRPVFFTYPFDLFPDYQLQDGVNYQFLPLDPKNSQLARDSGAARLYRFINQVYKSTPPNNFSSGISPGLDNGTGIFITMALDHLSKGETLQANQLLDRLTKDYNNDFPFSIINSQLGDCMLQAGRKEQGVSILESFAKNIMQLYKEPSALQPYIDKEFASSQISEVKEILKQHGMQSWIVNNLLFALENNR